MVISKIKPYTKYIFLHIKGEPLLHNNLDEILSICDVEDMRVNITTNGTLLKRKFDILKRHKSIRQINVSLHSENNVSNYYENAFEVCKLLSTQMFISYRLWTLSNFKLDEKSTTTVNKIIEYYQLSADIVDKLMNEEQIKIDNNTYVNKDNIFVWPEVSDEQNSRGYCYALKTHIGILSDGTVVPCCLDGEGVINLGNIFNDDLEKIFERKRYMNMKKSFGNNELIEDLCKSCTFRERLNRKIVYNNK